MKNIHVLPTDKPSRLVIDTIENKLYLQPILHENTINVLPHHIYITSDEEIKEEDWIYGLFNGGVILRSKYNIPKHTQDYLEFGLKIILTTDPNLIKDGVQAIDDEFLEWFVKNPSCDFVEIKEKQHFEADKSKRINTLNGVYYSYKIIIPQEEPKLTFEEYEQQGLEKYSHELKQETLEEAAEKYVDINYPNYIQPLEKAAAIEDFIAGAKWQAERMYSEEDMFEFSQWISHEDWVYLRSKGYWINEEQEELEQKLSSKEILNLWFEQFKKKQ